LITLRPPSSTLFPYTTLFRSQRRAKEFPRSRPPIRRNWDTKEVRDHLGGRPVPLVPDSRNERGREALYTSAFPDGSRVFGRQRHHRRSEQNSRKGSADSFGA